MGRIVRVEIDPVTRWPLALGLLLAALAIRLELTGLPPGYPFLTFFPAVALTAFLCGWRAGVAVAAAAGALAWWFFIRQPGTLSLRAVQDGLPLLLFAAIVALEIVLITATRIAVGRLDAERARIVGLLERHDLFATELQHRIGNSLQMAGALLALELGAVQDPRARAAITDATRRLDTLGRVHRQLQELSGDADPSATVAGLCRDLADIAGNPTVALDLTVPPLPPERLTALVLIISELMTNATKHARPGVPRIAITLAPTGQGTPKRIYRLTVADDGPGVPAGLDPAASASTGMRVMTALARQLDAALEIARREDGDGTVARLEFSA